MSMSDGTLHRDPQLIAMFSGPCSTARRIAGMRDARAGKLKMSSDPDYLTGYEAGMRYGAKSCANFDGIILR